MGNAGTILGTTDGGQNWTPRTSTVTIRLNFACFSSPQKVFAVGASGTILRSTDGGQTWTKRTSGTTAALNGAFSIDSLNLVAVASNGTITRTADGGETWNAQMMAPSSLLAVWFTSPSTGVIFGTPPDIGLPTTILRTTNGGTTWINVRAQASWGVIRSVAFTDAENGYAVGDAGVMLQTKDGGASWETLQSPTAQNLRAITFSGAGLLTAVGSGGAIIHTRPGGVTSAELSAREGIPSHFWLGQNYPNPFNPSTTIEFAIPRPLHVVLKVYNVLGEEVATLLNDNLGSGPHKIRWNAFGLPSGIYFYRLQAAETDETRTLILLR